MKHLLLPLTTLLIILGFSISSAQAQFRPNSQICDTARSVNSSAANSDLCKTNAATVDPLFGPSGIITIVINIFTGVVAVVAVIMIVIAGFMYVTSGGDPQKTNTAKDTILFAIVGLAIAAVGQVIVLFILDRLATVA